MHTYETKTGLAAVAVVMGLLTGCNPSVQAAGNTQASDGGALTNGEGLVTSTRVESNISTNNGYVTERRRETRTTKDQKGNTIESSSTEYVFTSNVKDFTGAKANLVAPEKAHAVTTKHEAVKRGDSFLGITFGEKMSEKDGVRCEEEPTLLRVHFTPKKPLPGFTDYYAYLSLETYRVVKLCACAKDSQYDGGRPWLVEALEERYGVRARPAGFFGDFWTLSLGSERYVRVYPEGASDNYETVIFAWDGALEREAITEYNRVREKAAKDAASRRAKRVKDAATAF